MTYTRVASVLLVALGLGACTAGAAGNGGSLASGPRGEIAVGSSGGERGSPAVIAAAEMRFSREPGSSAGFDRGIPMPEPAREAFVHEPTRELPTPQVPIPFVPDRGPGRGAYVN